ncbi:MAG TPA: hypothetical protein VJ917_07515, partial [Saprospiraceae bacterium]|nr:hypothetical protein [Saprospiraceae bacterium]
QGQQEDCLISEFCYSFDECINDSTYRVRISFAALQEGPWHIYVDGDSTFSVESSSFSETLLLSSEELHTISVEWEAYPDCFSQLTLPAISCPRDNCDDCRITDLFAEAGEPDENCEFYVDIEFNAETTCSDSFYVQVNGIGFGTYAYGELFYRLGRFNTLPRVLLIHVTDTENGDCQASYLLHLPECEQEECRIWDMTVDVGDIIDDSTFYITVDFNHQGTNPAGFDLYWDNQFYGFYSYSDLPLTILVETRGLEYEFLRVSDNDNEDCNGVIEFMSPLFTSNEEDVSYQMLVIDPMQVRIKDNTVKHIEWYDSLGRLLKSSVVDSEKAVSHPPIQSEGIYFIRWRDTRDNHYSRKVFLRPL